MSTSHAETDARAISVALTSRDLVVRLADGRRLSVPLAWFPRLQSATPAQRRRFKIVGRGVGIHWPDVDEDIGVAGLLAGRGDLTSRRPRPARRPTRA
jgi:hypothetical protein